MADLPIDLAALHRLTGTAYRWYGEPARVRADDLLVRSISGDMLCRAAEALRAEEVDIRQALPQPSRHHPFPDADLVCRLDQLRHRHARLQAVETRLRGGPCLPDRDFSRTDGVSVALRDILVRNDAALLAATAAVAAASTTLWDSKLADVETAIAARTAAIAAQP